MPTPQSDISTNDTTLHSARSLRHLDAVSAAALVCLLIGWFGMDALVTQLGPFRQAFRFYDMLAVIGSPMQLLTGLDRAHRIESLCFGVLCLAAAAAPVAAYVWQRRVAWLGSLVPLLLMVACFGALYGQTASHTVQSGASGNAFGGHIIDFAASITVRAGAAIAQYIAVGAGTYLAFFASIVLAVRGTLKYRAAADPATRR